MGGWVPFSESRQTLSEKNSMKTIIFVLLLLLLSTAAIANDIYGQVVGVTDGDTLTLLTNSKEQIKVRLAEIDTPERRQPYGSRAKQALSDLAFGKQARLTATEKDRYGRTVARIYVGNVDVNAELVRQGAAWVYRKYAHDPALFALETESRQMKRGLWALPEAERIPPWEWRHGGQTVGSQANTAPTAPQQATLNSGACGNKRYCKQMVDCAEARFYLKKCGLSQLDGDGDGSPCESLCR